MTLFYSHQNALRDPSSVTLRALARRAVARTNAALRIVHQAIVTAKTRRPGFGLMSRDEWPLGADSDQHDPDKKYPQFPLIIGDKWDF
jgi:hypothetical protein